MAIQLGKKVTDVASIQKIEAEIGRIEQIIAKRKLASRETGEGRKAAIELFEAYRLNCVTLQKQCYYQTNHVKMLRALGYSGEINALDFVIGILQGSDSTRVVYQEQLANLERQLSDLRKYPIRD